MIRRRAPLSALLLSAVSSLLFSGCAGSPSAGGGTSGTPTANKVPTFSGSVVSGATPIAGAAVSLYATGTVTAPSSSNNFGYAQAATLLGSADAVTDSKGAFKFSSTSTACPLGSYAYLVASGGSAGGGTNAGTLLMTVLGPCASLYDSGGSTYLGPKPVINEVTTVAAGYALANFTAVSGTTVNISAPVTDNFSDGSSAWNGSSYAACSGSACKGTATLDATSGNMNTYSNGLGHAVQTALNLADPSQGTAFFCIVNGVPSATCPGGGQYGIIPTAEINSLANALQLCVVTSGATGICPEVYADSASAKVTPTNTLQVVLNLAKTPSPKNTSDLVTLQTGQTLAYSPNLTAAPPDWCLMISYVGGALYNPQFLALDADDTVYVNSSALIADNSALVAISNAGSFVYGEFGANLASTGTGGAAVAVPAGIATDASGHVFVAANTNDATSGAYEFNTSDGSFVSYLGHNPFIPYATGVSVDRRNNLWISYSTYGQGNLDYALSGSSGYSFFGASNQPSGSTLGSALQANGAFSQVYTAAHTNLAFSGIDQNQNLWVNVAGDSTAAGKNLGIFVNGSSATLASQPYYNNSTTVGTGVFKYPEVFTTFTSPCTNTPYAVVFDSKGTAYSSEYSTTGTVAGLCVTTPTYTGGVLTGVSASTTAITFNTTSANARPQGLAMDGANVIWVPLWYSVTSSYFGLFGYDTVAKAAIAAPKNGLRGCFVDSTKKNICAATWSNNANFLAVANPRAAAVDSSGNIWTTQPSFATVVETIGLAAPTVPLLSAAKFGVRP